MGLDRLIGFDPQLLYEMFWTAINIFILFFGLSYLLFNPVRDMLEKRKQKIAGELADAANDKKSAAEMKAEYEQKLKEVFKEADAILEEARRKGKAKEAEIIQEAKAEAARIVERGNREVELERKKALDDMKQEIVSIASLMAEKVVASSIDMKVQDELIEETLKEMGESTWQS
mgnify:FL=1